jgi:hypothetical protein
VSELLSLELLAYRVAQAEIIQKAMQVELYDLRNEQRELRDEIMSEVQKRLDKRDRVRREWPLVVAGVTVAVAALASLILQLAH